jgi:hypothetical protein
MGSDVINFEIGSCLPSMMAVLYVHFHLLLDGHLESAALQRIDPKSNKPRLLWEEVDGGRTAALSYLFDFVCGEDGKGAAAFINGCDELQATTLRKLFLSH